jgi:hypothetical protein
VGVRPFRDWGVGDVGGEGVFSNRNPGRGRGGGEGPISGERRVVGVWLGVVSSNLVASAGTDIVVIRGVGSYALPSALEMSSFASLSGILKAFSVGR